MTAHDYKLLARRFYEEALNGGRLDVLDELLSPSFVDHGASSGQAPGIEGFKGFLKVVTGAFPDLHLHIEDLLAEGGKVAVRLTIHGTHEGVLMGNIQPTGKQAKWTGIDILHFETGRIVARWSERNLLGLMQQLGVI
jgi:predicted ester cyclase